MSLVCGVVWKYHELEGRNEYGSMDADFCAVGRLANLISTAAVAFLRFS